MQMSCSQSRHIRLEYTGEGETKETYYLVGKVSL